MDVASACLVLGLQLGLQARFDLKLKKTAITKIGEINEITTEPNILVYKICLLMLTRCSTKNVLLVLKSSLQIVPLLALPLFYSFHLLDA